MEGLARGGSARDLGDGVRPMKPRPDGLPIVFWGAGEERPLLLKSRGVGRINLSLWLGDCDTGVRTPPGTVLFANAIEGGPGTWGAFGCWYCDCGAKLSALS